MQPTETEHRIRGDVVRRIERIILSMWPEAQVHVFGSYRTGLYLPTSDIDLVVIGEVYLNKSQKRRFIKLEGDNLYDNLIRFKPFEIIFWYFDLILF